MYHVDINNAGGYSFNVKSGEHHFVADMKGAIGMTPPDVLLASLGTCIGVYLHKYAEGAKLTLPEFNINVTADFCKERPMRFKKIDVTVDLEGLEFDEHRRKAMTEFLKNCPVHNTLKGDPEVQIAIS